MLAAFSALDGPIQPFFVDTKPSDRFGHLTLHFHPPKGGSSWQLKDYVADVLEGDAAHFRLRFDADPASDCVLLVGHHDRRNGDLGRQIAAATDAVRVMLSAAIEETVCRRDHVTRAWETLTRINKWARQGTLALPIVPPPSPIPAVSR